MNLLGMVLISLLEGVGILLLIPMLSISGIGEMFSGITSVAKLFGFLHDFPKTIGLPFILGIYVVIVISQNLLQRNIRMRNVIIIQKFIHHARIEAYRLLLQANWNFFIKVRKSDLISLFTTEIGRLTGGINQFLLLITSLIFTGIQIAIAFWLSAKMTLFVIICGFLLAIFSRRFIKKSGSLGNKTSENLQEYYGGMTDQLNGIKEIKSNALEQSRLNWLQGLTKKMLVEQTEYIKLKTASQLFYKITSAILIALFIFFSVKMFHAEPGQFLLIIVIFSRIWPQITGIQSGLEQLASTIPAFKAFIELQTECMKASELKNIKYNINRMPIKIKTGIDCQNVFFRYHQNTSFYALQDINIHIPANCMTAIVGPSGAGKSTLIDLVMGLMKPEKGMILVDGIPLEGERVLSLRHSISYVPQDPFLFNASIRENLSIINQHASEEEMWEALKFSQAAEFVRRLPKGLNTLIGDRGIRLSGGERQRLVLARAILRKPTILILDEATSALDTENERKIQEAIEKLKGTMTIIVIAHRLSTIRNADQVIVLDEGKVTQNGGFTQLAKEKRGMFRHLLGNQAEVIP